jgi:hypothetical protein
MKNKHTFPFYMASDICNFCNRRTEGLTGPRSMYWETLRIDEDDTSHICDILTKHTYKIQNIIQN